MAARHSGRREWGGRWNTACRKSESDPVRVYQDGRVVKALDLRSNGHMSAWVRTPLLVVVLFFFFFFQVFNFFLNINFTQHTTLRTQELGILARRGGTLTTGGSASSGPHAPQRASGLAVELGQPPRSQTGASLGSGCSLARVGRDS